MPLFTHIVIGTNDPAKAAGFYDAALGALGLEGEQRGPLRFYRRDGNAFVVGPPRDGEPATFANGGTISFFAETKAQVDAFHAGGCANGGTCEGPPGRRPTAPNNAYGAYLREPDGNKICSFTFEPD